MPPGDPHKRLRRTLWAAMAFLVGFVIFITVLSHYFLIPGLEAARGASSGERRQLSAYAMLLMVLALLIVVVGILLTFRVRRFFLPKSSHGPTQYVDAWAESAARFKDSSEEEERTA
jgi:H+/Cl- antiporter ClcA